MPFTRCLSLFSFVWWYKLCIMPANMRMYHVCHVCTYSYMHMCICVYVHALCVHVCICALQRIDNWHTGILPDGSSVATRPGPRRLCQWPPQCGRQGPNGWLARRNALCLNVYICMCMYVYTCLDVFIPVHICLCACDAYIHVCAWVCMYVPVHVFVFLLTCIHACVNKCVHWCQIQWHVLTYRHTFTCMYMNADITAKARIVYIDQQ
jgi:hypothetical protein